MSTLVFASNLESKCSLSRLSFSSSEEVAYSSPIILCNRVINMTQLSSGDFSISWMASNFFILKGSKSPTKVSDSFLVIVS